MTDREEPRTQRNKGQKSRDAQPPPVDNVIRVEFGRGGGRVPSSPPPSPEIAPEPAADGDEPWRRSGGDNGEPVTDLFSAREVAKLLSMPATRLRTLDRAQIVSPSGSRQGRRAYTFQDLIALRATLLLSKDVKLREVARSDRRPPPGAAQGDAPAPGAAHRQRRAPGGRARQDGAFEPVTGQMVLDFQVRGLRDDVVRVLRPESAESRARTAYDLYTRASLMDEDPATYDEAEALYKRAIELDPHLAIAYTNLGNIRFRRGDDTGAEQLYKRALDVDSSQPEAHYNLGYVMLERGDANEAVPYFETAIARRALRRRALQPGDGARAARTTWPRPRALEALPRARAARHLGRDRAPAPLTREASSDGPVGARRIDPPPTRRPGLRPGELLTCHRGLSSAASGSSTSSKAGSARARPG